MLIVNGQISAKTAWFMLHRVRLAMRTKSFLKMSGEIEVDESFIGGHTSNMHKDRRERLARRVGNLRGKIAVIGMLKRNGADGHSVVRAAVIKNVRTHSVQEPVRENVEPGSTLYTDLLRSYKGLGPSYDGEYDHHVIDHAQAYVNGQIHTDSLENFWSLLKRTLGGTYVSVEGFHLHRYVDEQVLRFNTRKMTDKARFDAMVSRVIGKRITYADVIGKRFKQSA